ncbi:MAG: S41 family peptidase [Patescibacteria group bacterium]
MSGELPENDIEVARDLPSEVLTQISAMYPFLNKNEFDTYMEKATKIEAGNPIQEISALIGLLDNPHATFKKSKLTRNINNHETNPEKLPSSELMDNVLYINVPTLSGIQLEDLENVFLPYKDTSEGVIIDLRENGGGSEVAVRRFAEKYFIKKGEHKGGINIQIAPGGGLRHIQIPADSVNDTPYEKPVVILTSDKTFSSAERFIAIMKTGTDCVLIGSETRGGSANPVQTDIEYEGVNYTVSIPTWRFFLQGETKPIEDTKIKPDIPYEKEDIVDFAVQHIKDTIKKAN